jgi:hypothetical protein
MRVRLYANMLLRLYLEVYLRMYVHTGTQSKQVLPLKIIFQKKKTEKKESHCNMADKRKIQKETE